MFIDDSNINTSSSSGSLLSNINSYLYLPPPILSNIINTLLFNGLKGKNLQSNVIVSLMSFNINLFGLILNYVDNTFSSLLG